jgi:hypothetical protein
VVGVGHASKTRLAVWRGRAGWPPRGHRDGSVGGARVVPTLFAIEYLSILDW